MAVYTREDLVQRVLVRLGEVGYGQSAEPEARTRVSGALDGILDELGGLGLYEFAASPEVPGAAMDPLSAIVASRMSSDFNLPSDEISVLEQRATGAGQRLLRLKYQGFGSITPRRATYF